MQNSSFGESFNERLQKLCKKYEKIKDNEDEQIDLYNMNFIDNDTKTKKDMKKIEIGSLFTKDYKRKTDNIRIRYKFDNTVQEYDKIYKHVFCYNTFEDVYSYLLDKIHK